MVQAILGEIRCFAGQRAPKDWVFCEGQLLAISSHPQLFALIGTFYGGDGRTSFALPDLRSRVVVGSGRGPGLTARSMGSRFGEEQVVLTNNEMPVHRHPMQASTSEGDTLSPAYSMLADSGPGTVFYEKEHTIDQLRILSPGMIGSVGGNVGHDNLMPVFAVNYIIAMQGTFPQKN